MYIAFESCRRVYVVASVCLSVRLSLGLLKHFWIDFCEIFTIDSPWDMKVS